MKKNNRGVVLSTKLLVPERLWRMLTLPMFFILSILPLRFLYFIGYSLRSKKLPYSIIENGDIVVQVGAPRDLLSIGRSRAVYFMRCVGEEGKVVVLEPDPISARELKSFIKKNDLQNRVLLIEKGAWSEEGMQTFYSSPKHPASSLIEGAYKVSESEMNRRNYQKFKVFVATIDQILEEHDLHKPKLISITANGSETEILKGLQNTILNDQPYISLAITGQDYVKKMAKLGYELEAEDDRGYTFKPKCKLPLRALKEIT